MVEVREDPRKVDGEAAHLFKGTTVFRLKLH